MPGSPVRILTASSRRMFSVVLPSISMMMSPARTPAWNAGVPSSGLMTVRRPLRMPIWMPMPPNLPRILLVELGHLLFGDVVRERVQAVQHAVDGVLEELLGVNVADVLFLHEAHDFDEAVVLLHHLRVHGRLLGRGLEGTHQQAGRRRHQDHCNQIPSRHSPLPAARGGRVSMSKTARRIVAAPRRFASAALRPLDARRAAGVSEKTEGGFMERGPPTCRKRRREPLEAPLGDAGPQGPFGHLEFRTL